jgi:hypothetical protein
VLGRYVLFKERVRVTDRQTDRQVVQGDAAGNVSAYEAAHQSLHTRARDMGVTTMGLGQKIVAPAVPCQVQGKPRGHSNVSRVCAQSSCGVVLPLSCMFAASWGSYHVMCLSVFCCALAVQRPGVRTT